MSEELEQHSEDLVEKSKANKAAARYTGVVLGFVVVVMVIIFGFDYVFGQGIMWLYSAFDTTK
jgi:hypothetical protein